MDAGMRVDDHETFGARLRRLMLARGFNQTRLARRSGIDRTVLNRLISGKARPRPEHVGWLSVALDVEVDELTAGVELSTEVRRAIDLVQQGAARVLCMQRERDAAITLAHQLALELHRERLRYGGLQTARPSNSNTDELRVTDRGDSRGR